MTCPYKEKCAFFKATVKNAPVLATVYINKYCRNDFRECARFKAAAVVGTGKVPLDLYPNQTARALKIIEKHGQ